MDRTRGHQPTIVPAIIVGVFSVATALFGLYYNAASSILALRGAFDPMLQQENLTYFYYAFFIMSGICIFVTVTRTFQLPTSSSPISTPRWMSVSRERPRQRTRLPGGPSALRAR